MKLDNWQKLAGGGEMPEGYFWHIRPWYDNRGVDVQLRYRRRWWRDWRSAYRGSGAYESLRPEQLVSIYQAKIVKSLKPYDALPVKPLDGGAP